MPKKSQSLIPVEQIDGMIRTVRGVRIILDRDLAKIYGVATFRFNQAIKRNRHRFPPDFMFQLTREEFDSLKSQFVMSKTGRGGRRTLPYAFTEHGALQAANIRIICKANPFVRSRKSFSSFCILNSYFSVFLLPTS